MARLPGKRHAKRATRSSRINTEKDVSGSVVYMLLIEGAGKRILYTGDFRPMGANPSASKE